MNTRKVFIPIITVWLLLCSTNLFAQQTITGSQRNHFKTVDSLEQVLATNPPTGQDLLSIYRSLAWGNLDYDKFVFRESSMKP